MKRLIFLMIFVNVCLYTFAQSESENMFKYWHYRNRLKYFVIPGDKRGESEVISERNRMVDEPMNNPPPYKFKISEVGQHGVYFGYYLGVLATEYKLLLRNGQTNEAANTLHELDLALYQFENYMDLQAEGYWDKPDVEDGFFVRENMPCGFLVSRQVKIVG